MNAEQSKGKPLTVTDGKSIATAAAGDLVVHGRHVWAAVVRAVMIPTSMSGRDDPDEHVLSPREYADVGHAVVTRCGLSAEACCWAHLLFAEPCERNAEFWLWRSVWAPSATDVPDVRCPRGAVRPRRRVSPQWTQTGTGDAARVVTRFLTRLPP